MTDDDWAPAAASALAEVTGSGPRPRADVEVAGYTDLREVARGGDSIVYRARQISVDRDVAIKVIQVSDPADAARFARELEITVRLGRQHPHIVTVLDTTTTAAGEPCLVMEFHDLGSLHDRLRATGPLPTSDVVTAGTAVADALAFAHTHGVLHRDVKPQNVLVLPTSYVLSDFGIARMADAGHTATLERFSYRHASPQVLDGLAPTEADDVWSLGSTLFTLLDGRAPFAPADPDEDTALAYLRRVRTGERRRLQRDDVPEELVALIEDCLVADRDSRIGTAREALRRLRRIRTEDRSWNPAPAEMPEADVPTNPRPDEIGTGPDGVASGGAADRVEPDGVEPDGVVADGVASGPDAEADAAWAPDAASSTRSTSPSSLPSTPAELDEPSPVAPSVLAHVTPAATPSPAEPDGDHTGLAPEPDEEEQPSRRRSRRDGEESATSSPWRRIAAFLGGMLLVGSAIGVGSAFLQGGDAGEPTSPSSIDEVPSSDPPDLGTDPLQVEVITEAMSPQQLAIDDDRGTALVLSWTAPEQEVLFYMVVQVSWIDPDAPRDDPDNIEAELVGTPIAAPLTTTTLEGRDPDGTECYAVLGYDAANGDRGMSNVVCRT